jgi:hypothetical protein
MDWNDDTRTNLWVFPRGMQRDGAAGPNSAKWTSKYGSLGTAVYDAAVADGMNERAWSPVCSTLPMPTTAKPTASPCFRVVSQQGSLQGVAFPFTHRCLRRPLGARKSTLVGADMTSITSQYLMQ